jgi:hypothetical protein
MLHEAIQHAASSIRRGSEVARAAVVESAHDVLVALYPTFAADLDAQLAADLAVVRDAAARAAGVRIGAVAARRVLSARADDGSGATPPVLAPGTEPGQWRPTPPAFANAVFTHWSRVRPFVLARADQFRPRAYPPLTSSEYAEATNEVKSLGQDTSASRGADQTVQARFWAAPIWNYWNEIAQSVAIRHRTGLAATARLFAELNLAFADAVIAFYDAKYHFRIWRPVTAIRLGDTDANPATAADPAWSPLTNTPADPAYPGAHSVVAQTGALVLAHFFGPAERLTVTSELLPGVTRRFGNFQDAADEAGLSRIFAGVHTRLDHRSGQRLGHHIARFVLSRGQEANDERAAA